jgi:hypothetical protein
MLNFKHYFSILSIVLFSFIACSSSSNGSDGSNDANGTITLSGEDTSIFGTSLTVAKAVEGAYTTGTSKSVTLVHKNIDIDSYGEITPTAASFNEGFIIVVSQFESEDNAAVEKTISMIILNNGEEYRYVCTSDFGGGSDVYDCGEDFLVNQTINEIIFSNTTVQNTESNTILTLNGTVSY